MNPRQTKFVQEYLKDPNATQAAIKAGYSKKTAYSIGQRLLKNVEIASALSKRQAQVAEKAQVTAEWIVQKLIENHDRAMQAEPVMVKRGDEWVESGEYRYEGSVANKSLELLGKTLGIFVDKSAVDLTSGGKPLPADERGARLEAMLATLTARAKRK